MSTDPRVSPAYFCLSAASGAVVMGWGKVTNSANGVSPRSVASPPYIDPSASRGAGLMGDEK